MSAKKLKKEIVGFVEEELTGISRLLKEISDCKGNNSIMRRAKGSILHDFYNTCERVFEFVAHQINGGIPKGEQWYKKLLRQMTMEIKDLRPAVISKKLASELDEYLGFRHLFRNIYGFELESERWDELVIKFPKVAEYFCKEIRDFLKKL